MTNFVVYLIGTLLVVAGLAYGASRLGVSQVWIVAGALVIIGSGLDGWNREDATEGSGVVVARAPGSRVHLGRRAGLAL